jgi:hypothetical protein
MEAVAALLGLTLGENQYWLKVPDQFFQQEIVQKGKGGSAYVPSCQ